MQEGRLLVGTDVGASMVKGAVFDCLGNDRASCECPILLRGAARFQKDCGAMNYLGIVIDRLATAGFACEVASAGGAGTFDVLRNNPRVTEMQAGVLRDHG
jgi:hypothetical protein